MRSAAELLLISIIVCSAQLTLDRVPTRRSVYGFASARSCLKVSFSCGLSSPVDIFAYADWRRNNLYRLAEDSCWSALTLAVAPVSRLVATTEMLPWCLATAASTAACRVGDGVHGRDTTGELPTGKRRTGATARSGITAGALPDLAVVVGDTIVVVSVGEDVRIGVGVTCGVRRGVGVGVGDGAAPMEPSASAAITTNGGYVTDPDEILILCTGRTRGPQPSYLPEIYGARLPRPDSRCTEGRCDG